MIYETIVTTMAENGGTHIAPMGIREDGDLIVLSPFRPSATLDNVLHGKCAVVNYTDDVRVFAGCVTNRRRDWPTVPAESVRCHRLSDALAHTELALERVEEDESRPKLFLRPLLRVNHLPFRGFNRAQSAVVEGAILVSRLHRLPWEKISREIEYLAIAIDKTAGPTELEAWGWLMDEVSEFRRQQKEGAA